MLLRRLREAIEEMAERRKRKNRKEKSIPKSMEKLWQDISGTLSEVDKKKLFLTNLPYVIVFYAVINWHGFIGIVREIPYWND